MIAIQPTDTGPGPTPAQQPADAMSAAWRQTTLSEWVVGRDGAVEADDREAEASLEIGRPQFAST